MTEPARFLFDECLARPVVENQVVQLFRLYGAENEVAHLFTKFDPGTKDEVWIPQLASEGGWIIITTDQGKQSKKGQKLPEICREFRVTHIMLSTKLHTRNMYTKVLAIQHCLPSIMDVVTSPPGSGFLLQLSGADKFCLKKRTEALPPLNRTTGPQKSLFGSS